MSLNVHLRSEKHGSESRHVIFIREDGQTREITYEEWHERFPDREPVTVEVGGESVFDYNITHNLGKMASEAGLYESLWRPDEIGVTRADQLVPLLLPGLALLRAEPDRFKALNPENGWGSYDGLVTFVEQYLQACINHPLASVESGR